MRSLAAALVLCSLVLVTAAWVSAPPPPPPKFWTASRCEQVLLGIGWRNQGLAPGSGHGFGIAQAMCVGSGGPHACRWTTGHRSRLYSEFRVFTRSPLSGGVVRAWTLATRAGHGLSPVAQRAGDDQYAGWPPDFYMSRTKLLASDATPARFRSIVAPIAARLTKQENASECTGGN